MRKATKEELKEGQTVYDRWYPHRLGTLTKMLKTRCYIRWFDGEEQRYDKAHQQFLTIHKDV